jgi:hypothetical protein
MFESNSRYFNTATATFSLTTADGRVRTITYLQRRFLPSGDGAPTLVEHGVQQSDRLDNITARYLGDPTLFWRLCDANGVLKPSELTDEIGRVVQINLPQL